MAIIKVLNERRNSEFTLYTPLVSDRCAQGMVDVLNEGKPEAYYPGIGLKEKEDVVTTRGIAEMQYSLVDIGCCHAEGKRCFLNEGWKLSILPETYIV